MSTTGSPVPRSSYSSSTPLTATRSSMSVTPPGCRRGRDGVGFLGSEQAEGVVDGAVGDPEQDKIVVAGDHLMPGPGRDGRYVVGEEREGLAAAAQRAGAAGHRNDRAGGFPARPGPGPGGQALEQAAQGGQRGAAGDRVVLDNCEHVLGSAS